VIGIMLVDDHELVRTGIGRLLAGTGRFEIVGEAADGREALEVYAQARPDVVIMDILMPNKDGLDATKELLARFPEARVLVLSGHGEPDYVGRLLAAGASGFVTKSDRLDDLEVAIDSVMRGEKWLSPELRGVLHDAGFDPGEEPSSALTDRELQVVRMIATGMRNRDIAAQLCISRKTVDTHRANALGKLALETNADLTRFAIRSGLVER